jgi:hypothetical protein
MSELRIHGSIWTAAMIVCVGVKAWEVVGFCAGITLLYVVLAVLAGRSK